MITKHIDGLSWPSGSKVKARSAIQSAGNMDKEHGGRTSI
jgi:hypothetical protein